MRTRVEGKSAGHSSRLGPSIDAEMDEDGVDIPAGEGAPVVFGEIELGDGTAEGVAAGNIHTGGGEEEERFELSAASAATRERQEELLREFEQRRRQRSVAVTTDDSQVRKQLRALGEPITLFGEGPGDRRDRLRKKLAELDAQDGGELALPEEALVVEEQEVQKELFYTEGSANLMRARTAIASFSLPRAKARIERAKRRRADPEVDEVAELNAAAAATASFANETSQLGDGRPLSSVRFSTPDDGAMILSASWGGVARLWRSHGCEKIVTIRAHENRCTGADFHPSATLAQVEETAASGSSVSTTVSFGTACADGVAHLWSPGGKHLRTLKGHADRLGRMAFHPCGDYVATASFDKTWRLWSVETGEELLCQEGHSRPVYDLSFHPDGGLCATVGLEAHGRVWDLRSGKCVTTLVGHVKQCLSVDFSPNGFHIVTGSDDHTARIWDLRRRGCLYTVPAHSSLISSVRYEPKDGGFFATSSYDGTAQLYSSRDFSRINTLRGHEARVMCADVAPGGNELATVSYDRTLKLWRQQRRGKAVKEEEQSGPVEMEL